MNVKIHSKYEEKAFLILNSVAKLSPTKKTKITIVEENLLSYIEIEKQLRKLCKRNSHTLTNALEETATRKKASKDKLRNKYFQVKKAFNLPSASL